MASNVREFNLAIDQWINQEVPERAAKQKRAVLLEGLRGVVLATPVDKGRAKGGWEVELEQATITKDRDARDKTGIGALTRGIRQIRDAKPFTIDWITNAVPYIGYLEDGSSKQAPAGMVRVTVNRLRTFLAARKL